MTPSLSVRDLRHPKGHGFVLEIPALDLEGPGLVALVGPNGAGKTTLLRLLSLRVERPAAGRVACTAPAREVVLVDQHPYMFSGSVADNVAYGLKVRRVPRRLRGGAVARALSQVGLAGAEGRPARALSGGQRHRVAIARALAVAPRILLLDEPDAGLDGEAVAALETLLADLARERLVVLSTHDRARAVRLAGRVLALEGGRLARGTPAPVPARPVR